MPPRRNHLVLCVDDEPPVLESLRRALRGEPYEIATAGRPEEALQSAQRRRISVLITDHRMPGMTGAELLKSVRARSPRTRGVILTGGVDMDDVVAAIHDGAVRRLFYKPWDDDELREAVRLLIAEIDRDILPAPDRLQRLTLRDLRELRISRAAISLLPIPVATVAGEDLEVRYCNRAFAQVFRATPLRLRGVPILSRIAPAFGHEIVAAMKRKGHPMDIITAPGDSLRVGVRRLKRPPAGSTALIWIEGNAAALSAWPNVIPIPLAPGRPGQRLPFEPRP